MSNFLVTTPEPLHLEAISTLVSHETCGAISMFVLTNANNFEPETYELINEKDLERICDKIRSGWKDVKNIAIYNRIGLIASKEARVIIAIASPYQQCSLEALGYAIEQLKTAAIVSARGLNFNEQNKECLCEDKVKHARFCFSKSTIHAEIPVPTDLVQITANGNEIRNRIERFITTKREEIDQNNIVDYMNIDKFTKDDEDGKLDYTCARVNSAIVKQERSKCHLKVFRVKNVTGPQTRPNYFRALDKLMTYDPSMKLNPTEREKIGMYKNLPTSAHNRLEVIEQHLFRSSNHNLPISRRLKEIEDRILRLESISPEYWHFIVDANNSPKISKQNLISDKVITKNYGNDPLNHKIYTANELDCLMQQIQSCKDMEIN